MVLARHLPIILDLSHTCLLCLQADIKPCLFYLLNLLQTYPVLPVFIANIHLSHHQSTALSGTPKSLGALLK